MLCVCIFGISFTYLIKSIDLKLNSVCLINDYSLIADLHIFVYERAKCASISLKYTKVKFLILNNFCTNFVLENLIQGMSFVSFGLRHSTFFDSLENEVNSSLNPHCRKVTTEIYVLPLYLEFKSREKRTVQIWVNKDENVHRYAERRLIQRRH